MGVFDNIRNLFKGKEKEPVQIEDVSKKASIAMNIVDLVDKIKKLNSFDSSIWNLANVSSYELQRKSLAELEQIQASLQRKLSALTKQSKQTSYTSQEVEKSKWTGQKPRNLSNYEFDRLQRDEGR